MLVFTEVYSILLTFLVVQIEVETLYIFLTEIEKSSRFI